MVASTLEIIKSEIGRLLGLDGHQDPQATNGEYSPFVTGDGLAGMRIYPVNRNSSFKPGNDYRISHPVKYTTFFDDFLGKQLDTNKWNQLTGSDGSCAAAYNAQTGGVLRLTSGAGSTHTVAVNGAQITGGLNFLASQGIRCEADVGKISALTSQNIFIGLTDATTLKAPFTISGTTFTGNDTNAVGFVEDSAATGAAAKLNAVAINAGGAVQSVNLGIDIDTAAKHQYRVDVNELGNATFYVDGVQVATIAAAVATTAVLAPTVEMFSNATSASQTLDVDYVLTEQLSYRI